MDPSATDEVLLDQLERQRDGGNTHKVSNLRQAYMGAVYLERRASLAGDVLQAGKAQTLVDEARREIVTFVTDRLAAAYRTYGRHG